MVATPNPNRSPLLPSERDTNTNNNNNGVPNPNTRPKSKTVSSRYLLSPATSSSSSSTSSSTSSFSTPRRSPSPLLPLRRAADVAPPQKPRSASADRRRSSPLRRDDVASPAKLTATRSLSVSFQGESFSLPVRKTPPPPPPPRRRPGAPAPETPKRPDHHRWPARARQLNPNSTPLTKSFDSCTLLDDDKHNVVGSSIELNDKLGKLSKFGKLGTELNDSAEILKSMRRYQISNETDSDSVSSGSSNSGSTKFWQEQCILPKYPPKMVVPPKFGQPKKFPMDATSSSPMRGSVRPSSPMRGSSPSRAKGSIDSLPLRGMNSPLRVRSSISSSFSETPSVLSYAVDVKRGKVGENQIMDAHTLRLLYNRQLQWRFVNARKEAVLLAQRRSVQNNLWNAWIRISNLRESVTRKTHQLHLMKQKMKLASILKDQRTYLEDWAFLDKGHCTSLLGSIEALKGSTLRLPVVDGAITDLQSIKDAIGSAVDVMQAMASSICSILLKVEEMSSSASELTKEISKEQALLEQCRVNFIKLAAQQVEYCTLRTHILQANRTFPLA